MTGRDGTGNPNFYNAPSHKATKTSKLLVGSYNVDMQHKASPHPFIGNQAAPQNHMDVGTNIVFRGVHSEGGIKGVRGIKSAHSADKKKSLVGSYPVARKGMPKPYSQKVITSFVVCLMPYALCLMPYALFLMLLSRRASLAPTLSPAMACARRTRTRRDTLDI